MKDHPDGPYTAEARFEQGNALTEIARFGEAILIFQEIINKLPDSRVIPQTWLRIGDCQFMLGTEDMARYDAALTAFQAAVSHPAATSELSLQANYKIGRCLQKLDREDEAIQHYYAHVMMPYLRDSDAGIPQSETARMWFGRASRDAADSLERKQEWRKVISILERARDAGAPDEASIRQRIERIRSENWWLFY